MTGDERVYEFGDFRLVPRDKRLLHKGMPVPLPPKVFDTLALLVERHGTLVDKDELMKGVWPDTFVEDVALAHNLSLVRKALRAADPGSEFIETVPKRGYRFVSQVRERGVLPNSPKESAEAQGRELAQRSSQDVDAADGQIDVPDSRSIVASLAVLPFA